MPVIPFSPVGHPQAGAKVIPGSVGWPLNGFGPPPAVPDHELLAEILVVASLGGFLEAKPALEAEPQVVVALESEPSVKPALDGEPEVKPALEAEVGDEPATKGST